MGKKVTTTLAVLLAAFPMYRSTLSNLKVGGSAVLKVGADKHRVTRISNSEYTQEEITMSSQAIARLQTVASDAKIKKLENEKKACQKTIDAIGEKIKKLKQRKLPDLKPGSPEIKSLGQARKRIKEIDQEIKTLKAAE